MVPSFEVTAAVVESFATIVVDCAVAPVLVVSQRWFTRPERALATHIDGRARVLTRSVVRALRVHRINITPTSRDGRWRSRAHETRPQSSDRALDEKELFRDSEDRIGAAVGFARKVLE